MGWVHKRRDHGGVVFVDLRDRYGLTQVVFHEDIDPAIHSRAELVRPEYVIAVEGEVKPRGAGAVNPNLATGEIELVATRVWILNESRTPPFPMEEHVDVAEEVRLKIGNTGRPIVRNLQEHIFERFHHTSDASGHGLGLNLARELALLHRGDLKLVCSKDDWTEFELCLRGSSLAKNCANPPG